MNPLSSFAITAVFLTSIVVVIASDAIYNDQSSSSSHESEESEPRERRQVIVVSTRTGRPLAGELNDFDKIPDQQPVAIVTQTTVRPPPLLPPKVVAGYRRGRSARESEENSGESAELPEAEEEERPRSERAVDKSSVRPRPTMPPRPIRPLPKPKIYPTGGRRGRSVGEESKESEKSAEVRNERAFDVPPPVRHRPTKRPSVNRDRIVTQATANQESVAERNKRNKDCRFRRSRALYAEGKEVHISTPRRPRFTPRKRGGSRTDNANGLNTSERTGEKQRATRRPIRRPRLHTRPIRRPHTTPLPYLNM